RVMVPRELPGSRFFPEVLAGGGFFMDRPFGLGGPMAFGESSQARHGENAHAFQIPYVQPEIEAEGVTVPRYLRWLSSTPLRQRIWNSIFDPLNTSVMRPELMTPAIRQALGEFVEPRGAGISSVSDSD